MGLFSWFKANDFASMDEIEQMKIMDKFGLRKIKTTISTLEQDVESIKATLTEKEEITHWQDSIITAEEAARRLRQVEERELPKELNSIFREINNAIDGEQSRLILFEYERAYPDAYFDYSMKRVYHADSVAKELSKYNYDVRVEGATDEFGEKIIISWSKNNPKIDPDKKYILPMEGSDRFAKKDLDKWIFIGDGRTAEEASHSTCLYHNDTFTVQGREILDGPDWVKAIKPIEVEE